MPLTSQQDGQKTRFRLRNLANASGEYASFATMRLHEGDDRAVLKPTRGMYAFGIVMLLASAIPWGMFTGLCLDLLKTASQGEHAPPALFRIFEGGFSLVGMVISGIVGTIFAGLGLLVILTTAGRQTVFDKFNKIVIDQKGLLGRKREEIPLRDLTGLELLETTQSAGPGWKLELVFGGSQNRRLPLMHHAKHEALLADAQQLARFLKTPLREVTLAQQAQESGDWTLAVPQSPMARSTTNMKTAALKVLPSGDLAFVPAIGMKVFWGVFLLFGLGALLAVGFNLDNIRGQESGLMGLAIGGIVGTVFTVVGFFGLRSGKTITISRLEGRIYKPGRKGFDLPTKGLKAVQLLSRYVSGSGDSGSYTCYEINLVLPDGHERAHLFCSGKAKSIRADAQQLAEFLDVPLLDQTT